jgi:hypothetical protein
LDGLGGLSTEAVSDHIGGRAQAERPSRKADVGVVFIHGVGSQGEGDTLVQFGDPFVGFISGWVRARCGSAELDRTIKGGPGRSWMTVANRTGAQTVLLSESWWADAFRGPSGTTTAWFVLSLTPTVLSRVLRIAKNHLVRISGTQISGPIGALAAIVKAVLGAMTFVGALLLAVVAAGLATVVTVALVVGQILPPVRDPATMLLAALAGSLGDSWSLVRSDIRASEMVSKVTEDLAWASARAEKLVVVAHSQGAAIALASLSEHWHDNVVLLVTFGSAINILDRGQRKSVVDRFAARLDARPRPTGAPVHAKIASLLDQHHELRWHNFYTVFDPVSAGRLLAASHTRLVECAVVNVASVIRDHPGYFDNAEQVIAPIAVAAMGISDFQLTDALGSQALEDAAQRRSRRALTLLGAKLVAVLLGIAFGAAAIRGAWGVWLAKALASGIRGQSAGLATWLGNLSPTALLVSDLAVATLLGVVAMGSARVAWERWNVTTFRRLVQGPQAPQRADSIWFRVTVGTMVAAVAVLSYLGLNDLGFGQMLALDLVVITALAAEALCFVPPKPQPWPTVLKTPMADTGGGSSRQARLTAARAGPTSRIDLLGADVFETEIRAT